MGFYRAPGVHQLRVPPLTDVVVLADEVVVPDLQHQLGRPVLLPLGQAPEVFLKHANTATTHAITSQ